jgi:hypothetical protein
MAIGDPRDKDAGESREGGEPLGELGRAVAVETARKTREADDTGAICGWVYAPDRHDLR